MKRKSVGNSLNSQKKILSNFLKQLKIRVEQLKNRKSRVRFSDFKQFQTVIWRITEHKLNSVRFIYGQNARTVHIVLGQLIQNMLILLQTYYYYIETDLFN